MTSFQRAFALFLIVISTGFLAGCGPEAAISGDADSAADAGLSPEGEAESAAPEEVTEAKADDSSDAASDAEAAPES